MSSGGITLCGNTKIILCYFPSQKQKPLSRGFCFCDGDAALLFNVDSAQFEHGFSEK
jgi:hypothetical protein